MVLGNQTANCDDKSLCCFAHICSLGKNSIGDTGAKALAEGLQHCTNVHKLE